MKTIVFTHRAAQDLDALSDNVRDQVMSALAGYAMTGEGGAKPSPSDTADDTNHRKSS